ncbi:MAG TPA: tetratricopeptide repeat protein, partial [Deltaproteobacteria bacterium]|nr:tetratricopeptide repeat protein [Deltaproteobacteria bacterium]
ALPVAWDSRPEAEGGQRWFGLQPGEPTPPGDPLHWKGLAYNWNSQCASCHSTRLEKGYDAALDRFDTRYAEIDVGCEACHGPGSRHVSIERGGGMPSTPRESGLDVTFETWDPGVWQRTGSMRIAARTRPRAHDVQIDVCGPCHSRRTRLVASPGIGTPFLDGHRPRLLDPGLYFDDGRIRDEVYVWGSFLQSRMAMAGVRCSDCHDPHSLRLRRKGKALCLGCHAREEFDAARHHGHEPDSDAGECVACHMPERIYMRVDGRRDHSFPIPRPETSALLDAPTVCEGCHPGRGSEWAEGAIRRWRRPGRERPGHWSDRLVREGERREDPERWLEIALDDDVAPIVRASAWSRYAGESTGAPSLAVLQARSRQGTALERLALVEIGRRLGPGPRMALLRPLLEDERRAVRTAAAEALSDLPASGWLPADRVPLAGALREYRRAQAVNAERPESQVNLGTLALRLGDFEGAREAFRRAVSLAPYFVPAYANWADLERRRGRDAEAAALLGKAVSLAPDDPLMRHAYGLALHRTGDREGALAQLETAARSAPDDPRLVLGWALALDGIGRRDEAITILEALAERGRADADALHALVALMRDAGQLDRALAWVHRWLEWMPGDPRALALEKSLVDR